MALEAEFWSALAAIARKRQQNLSALVAEADAAREPGRPLASALRLLALQDKLRDKPQDKSLPD